MNILSLFDGIACGRVALERAGIKVDKYYASEIDKYAIKVSTTNYPDIIQLGDIKNWKQWDITWSEIDLVIGGSPCQGFSNAGKGLNFSDPRSALFFEFVNILNHVRKFNPNVKFLLENVKMKKEWVDIITEYINVNPIEINSSLVSAQDRKRLYWTNIPIVALPNDKKIMFQSVITNNSDEFKYCNTKNMKHLMRPYGSKAQIITKETTKTPTLISAMGTGGGNGIYYAEIANDGYCFSIENNKIIVENNKYDINLPNGTWRFRKLTPIECERLQTLPDDYTKGISNSQRYKCLGNGWTVNIITHIFSFI